MKKRIVLVGLLVLLAAALLLYHSHENATPTASQSVTSISEERLANRPEVLLVNAVNGLPADYQPAELVNLYAQKRHFLLATSDIELEREAFEAANRMFKHAEDENMNGFILTSGYRSRERQEEIYAETKDGTAQLPGHSEHETGLAFDVTARYDSGSFEDTPQFAWLMAHCWDYGFILRYPQGKEEITGIAYEPWHYRYVGAEAAQIIRATGWTLEEYCAK